MEVIPLRKRGQPRFAPPERPEPEDLSFAAFAISVHLLTSEEYVQRGRAALTASLALDD